MRLTPGARIGAYEIVNSLGSGGMGEVFRARDTRLDRDVALKVISEKMACDETAMKRFEREAKAIARLSHPNIVAIHDFSLNDGMVYAVTELLEGKSLRETIDTGRMPVSEALRIGTAIAEGLASAHERGIIHRDLKPENVFLTRDQRVKILDFGLALTTAPEGLSDGGSETLLTTPGMIVGTVGYMSPEQVRGEPITPASDVFAWGCVMHEMLTGTRTFARLSTVEMLAAILMGDVPPLSGTVPDDLRTIVMGCLQKEPAARYAAAGTLLEELRAARRVDESATVARPQVDVPGAKRLIVLPFRFLRADAEFDFLSLSLPEAITSSLAAIGSIIVRSSAISSQYADRADLRAVAEETAVDWILTGSLLRAASQLRVSAQLVKALGGTVIWSHSFETSVSDIFQIQDDLTRRIVDSLAIPLTEGEQQRLRRDVPASALGYELFLKANQQAHGPTEWRVAREIYVRAIEEDPRFAPAHARLGRIQWLLAKYTDEGDENWRLAERSLGRALELNPDLNLAHRFMAELKADLGHADEALARILERLRHRTNDPELHIALVKICRYCGLLDESLKAHHRARQIDPKIASSVAHTYFMQGDYAAALESVENKGDIGYIEPLIVLMLGQVEEAKRQVDANLSRTQDVRLQMYLRSLGAILDGDLDDLRAAAETLEPIRDPEALFYVSRTLVRGGDPDRGLDLLERIVPGFSCVTALENDPWLDAIRSDERYQALLERARTRRDGAAQLYARFAGSQPNLSRP